ncbi:MAG: zinc ribbon domain-containing protein [Candidatus Lokiarchaeota archaeon]|nr:zinc ribbon domain-containing protein [Candidatus Lokiarchaeota archaeon]
MEKNSQGLTNFANKRFSEIISEGFRLFFKNYRKLILPLAFFQLILIISDILLLTDLKVYINSIGVNVADLMTSVVEDTPLTASEWNLISEFLLLSVVLLFLQNLIGAIIITIAMCSVSNYILKKLRGIDTNFFTSFKSSFNKKMFIVIFIIGILLPVSAILLYIPAIMVFSIFIFLVFTYNNEDVEKPISEARAIAKGMNNKLKIIGVFIFNFIIIFIFSFIYGLIIDFFLNPEVLYNYNLWLAPGTRNYGLLILYQILLNLVSIVLAPLFICLLTVLFASLKDKKDLGFKYQRTYYSVKEEPTLISQDADRFYCPYCGVLINKFRRFCPRCGENLSSLVK